MAASMENAPILIYALDIDTQLLLQQVYFLVQCQRLGRQPVKTVINLLEYPRTAKRGTSNHEHRGFGREKKQVKAPQVERSPPAPR